MTDTTKLFELAQLAEASYANLWDERTNTVLQVESDVIAALIASGFSQSPSDPNASTQAADFVTHWSVISHQPNTGSGFSATLFQRIDNDPLSGYQAGQYVYALRGTEPLDGRDLPADVGDIVMDGLALEQIVDMYNDWQRLNTPAGQSYQAAFLAPVDGVPATGQYVVDKNTALNGGTIKTIIFRDSATAFDATDPRHHGAGALTNSGELTVTGHSLGGHLAAAFTRLFPGMAEAVTINGAGFATGDIQGTGGMSHLNIANLFGMLGGDESFGWIQNIYGDKAPEIVTQNGPGLWQQGAHDALFIENWSVFNTFGHGSSQMTDSLAVYDLFIRLDGNSGRVQFLAQHLAQRTDRYRGVAFHKRSTQSLVNQRLVALPLGFRALPESRQNGVIQIDRDASLAGDGNHRATFGMGHIVFSLHSISFHKVWPTAPKSAGQSGRAPSSTPPESAPTHPRPRLRSVPRQWYPYLPASTPEHRKTPVRHQRTKCHASSDWPLPYADRIQKSCAHNTYNICTHQVESLPSANRGFYQEAA